MNGRWKRVAVGSAVAAAIAIGGGAAAYATGVIGGGSSGVIVGCAKKDTGDLRIVGDASQCRRGERVVAFQAPIPPPAPQYLTVDCGAGQSVDKALAGADPTEPVTITIKGRCTEAVTIARGDVTLNGNAPGDGITAPAGANSALSLNGAQRAVLNQLTLTGGAWTLLASSGSSFYGSELHVSGGSDTGVAIDLGASGQLHDPAVDGSHQGVHVSAGGSLSIDGGTVSNSATFGISSDGGHTRLGGGLVISNSGWNGLFAGHGGSIEASDTTVETSGQSAVFAYNGGAIHLFGDGVLVDHNSGQGVSALGSAAVQIQDGVRITNNGQAGVTASGDAALQIQGATITGNTGQGVVLSLASTAEIDGTTITGNSSDGVYVGDTSVVQFNYGGNGNNTITGNGGWGVTCQGAPAVAMMHGRPGTVSGNTYGPVNCPSV